MLLDMPVECLRAAGLGVIALRELAFVSSGDRTICDLAATRPQNRMKTDTRRSGTQAKTTSRERRRSRPAPRSFDRDRPGQLGLEHSEPCPKGQCDAEPRRAPKA